jgi:AcrR family transcriptional regulator
MVMINQNEDRRVKYTKMVLKESFINLLSKKGISNITIKQICEDADINRATFYTHYSDQYDLLKKIEGEFLENVKIYISEFKKDKADVVLVDLLEKIFGYIKDNAQLCRLLLSEQSDMEFQKRIMMLIYDSNISIKAGENLKKGEEEYIYAFVITGCVGVIQKWLDEGMKESSRFMANAVFDSVKKLPITFV